MNLLSTLKRTHQRPNKFEIDSFLAWPCDIRRKSYLCCLVRNNVFLCMSLDSRCSFLSYWATGKGRLRDPATQSSYKDEVVLLNAIPKNTTSKLAGFSPHYPFRAGRQEASCAFHFLVFWYDPTRG